MRRIMFTLCLLFAAGVLLAQEENAVPQKGNFDAKDFEERLEQHVIQEAGLTKAEEEKFLPLYQEMRLKQVQAMKDERTAREKKPTTETECEAVIKAHDEMEVELKKLVQEYHDKMLAVIPASKLIKVMKAEQDFHRDSFREHVGVPAPPQQSK